MSPVRLRRSADYRRIYKEGSRYSGPLFAAFYRRSESEQPPRVGYTTPRSMGKSVIRNRIKRRFRAAVRLLQADLPPGWEVVFNPRRGSAEVEFPRLTAEVGRLFAVIRSKA